MHQKNREISKSDLSGKTYLMTGGNSGIGYEAIRNFASRGASVILVCRSAVNTSHWT
jgi:NAD(P)-dependent dehydrogenase (short-subunit alcohol dehydrogenase family)